MKLSEIDFAISRRRFSTRTCWTWGGRFNHSRSFWLLIDVAKLPASLPARQTAISPKIHCPHPASLSGYLTSISSDKSSWKLTAMKTILFDLLMQCTFTFWKSRLMLISLYLKEWHVMCFSLFRLQIMSSYLKVWRSKRLYMLVWLWLMQPFSIKIIF